jgi:hypothetical protein
VYGVDTSNLATASVSGHVHHSGPGGHGDPGPYWDWQYYAALLRWDGSTEQTRPLRAVVTTAQMTTPPPAGWANRSRRAISDDRCASHSDPYAATYWRAQPDPAGSPAEFTIAAPAPGVYQLALWWPRVKNANPATPVVIQAGSGPATSLTADQSRNPGRWNDISGEITVTARVTVTVRILPTSSERGWILADAVRLLRLRSAP